MNSVCPFWYTNTHSCVLFLCLHNLLLLYVLFWMYVCFFLYTYIFFFHCNHRRQFLWSSVVVNGEWSIRNSFLLSLSWVLIPYISLSIILFFSLWKSVEIYPFSIEKCCEMLQFAIQGKRKLVHYFLVSK